MGAAARSTDQQFAGILMAFEQSIVFFVVFAYWVVRFFAEQDEEAAAARVAPPGVIRPSP